MDDEVGPSIFIIIPRLWSPMSGSSEGPSSGSIDSLHCCCRSSLRLNNFQGALGTPRINHADSTENERRFLYFLTYLGLNFNYISFLGAERIFLELKD